MRVITVICFAALVLALAGLSVHRFIRITPDSLVRTLSGQAPPGTTAQRLSVVLDSMGLEHSQPVFAKNGDAEIREPGRRIYAAVRDLRRGKLYSDGVFLVVALDVQDRVLD